MSQLSQFTLFLPSRRVRSPKSGHSANARVYAVHGLILAGNLPSIIGLKPRQSLHAACVAAWAGERSNGRAQKLRT
jgi:hypothetical protein